MTISIVTFSILFFNLVDHADEDVDSADKNVDTVNFADFEDVADAFTALIRIFTEELDDAKFETIRITCLARANKKLQDAICKTSDVRTLCRLLACHPLVFNWMHVDFLQTMAVASGNKKLQDVIKSYNDIVLNRKLGEIWNSIPSFHHTKEKYYSQVQAKFVKEDPDSIKVNDLKKLQPTLAKKIAMHIMWINKGSLTITWCILAEETYKAYLLALQIPQESREDDFLQIGMWIVYHPQLVLQKLKRVCCEY